MKRAMFYLTIVLIAIIGFGYSNNVSALYISAPSINGVSYVSENEIKLNYNTNNINPSYKVQIFNSTLGKNYTTEVNSTSYNVKGLTYGKTYNFLMRVYSRTTTNTYVSNWSNIVSGTPKANAPVINSITSGNGMLALNYKVSGSPKGVQIYIYNTKKSYTTTNLSNYTFTGLTNGTKYKFIIRNYYEGNIYGPWSGSKEGTPTKPVATPSTSAVVIAKALTWAKRIADDNSYHYGTKHGGTCKLDKKLINCSCFAWKAYEVGAGIKVTRVSNYRYNYWAYGIPTNLNNTKGFKSMGKLSKSKLQPGDILIKKTKPSSSHVEMFWKHSNGTYYTIGAHGHETKSMSKAKSISVKNMTINYTHVYRYVG